MTVHSALKCQGPSLHPHAWLQYGILTTEPKVEIKIEICRILGLYTILEVLWSNFSSSTKGVEVTTSWRGGYFVSP